MKKRLLIDVNSVVPYFTKGYASGVGRSTFELIKALNKIEDIPFDIILYSQNMKGVGAKSLKTDFRSLHFYVPNRHFSTGVINYFGLKRLLSHYDLMHIPHNTDRWENISKTIYTIHDLIVYRYPEMWRLTEDEKKVHNYIAQNCKAIVTCSEASKRDIVDFWHVSPSKVTVIPWGVNRELFSPDYKPLNISGLSDDFFFCSSCNHPRKQVELIVASYRRYLAIGGKNQLVLLNPKLDYSSVSDLISNGRLIIVSGINDTMLVQLYSQSKATIVVSLYEGFGLPVLESLACHTQVLCARNSSLVEAGGNVVDYIPELSEIEIAQSMYRYDTIKKKDLLDIDLVEQHLKNFTWENCASKYVKFYEKMLYQ